MDWGGVRWQVSGGARVCVGLGGHRGVLERQPSLGAAGLLDPCRQHPWSHRLDFRALLWAPVRVPIHLEAPQQRHAHAFCAQRLLGRPRGRVLVVDVLAQRACAVHPETGRRLATGSDDGAEQHPGLSGGHAFGHLLRGLSVGPRPLFAAERGPQQHRLALDRAGRLPDGHPSVCRRPRAESTLAELLDDHPPADPVPRVCSVQCSVRLRRGGPVAS